MNSPAEIDVRLAKSVSYISRVGLPGALATFKMLITCKGSSGVEAAPCKTSHCKHTCDCCHSACNPSGTGHEHHRNCSSHKSCIKGNLQACTVFGLGNDSQAAYCEILCAFYQFFARGLSGSHFATQCTTQYQHHAHCCHELMLTCFAKSC